MEYQECACCVSKFSTRRKQVQCPKCKFTICNQCFERYTLDNLAIDYIGTICMSCKEPLSFDFITSNSTKSFVSKKYKDKRKEILIGIETSKLPDTQNSANAYKEYKKEIQNIINQVEDIKQKLLIIFENLDKEPNEAYYNNSSSGSADFPFYKIEKFYDVYQYYNRKLYLSSDEQEKILLKEKCKTLWDLYTSTYDLKREIVRLENEINIIKFNLHRFEIQLKLEDDDTVETNFEKKERKTFIMPCPLKDCKGFMSTGYKCGLCEGKICSKCHIELNEKDEEHECDKNLLESVKAINHETRPCPKCGARIYKTEGCFAENTPIPLWNGTQKLSQDIVIGDVLIGDDGNPRTVQKITSGYDQLYEIKQHNGMSYTVNSKHTLVLIDKSGSIINKIVDDYLLLSLDTKNELQGYKYNKKSLVGEKNNITVSSIGIEKYYGWMIDGNHRFILPDYTVVKNCDQMWCISCKTAFSWDTGKIVQGERIHNPEYFRWLREHNQEIPRVEDQLGCEDLPPYYVFDDFVYQGIINYQTSSILVNLLRMITHINEVEIPHKKNRINRDLRVRYLTDEINMENMRIQLMKRERFNMRNTFIIGMLRLIVDVIRDKLRLCSRQPELINESILELVSLSKYINEQMENFTKTHGLITPRFKETENNLFEIVKRPRNKKKNDKRENNNQINNEDQKDEYLDDYDYGDHGY